MPSTQKRKRKVPRCLLPPLKRHQPPSLQRFNKLKSQLSTKRSKFTKKSPIPFTPLAQSQIRSVHVSIQEQLSLTLLQAGGLKQLDLKGSLNLLIATADASKAKLNIEQNTAFIESLDAKSLQYKYHPRLARTPGGPPLEEAIKLKDPEHSWPVGTPLGVLRWRATSKDESLVPLSSLLSCSSPPYSRTDSTILES